MKLRSLSAGIALAGLAIASPSWAVSLSSIGPEAEPLNSGNTSERGSASLVPLMAAEVQPTTASNVEQSAATGAQIGKPLDDISFFRAAAESGRKEVSLARDALPSLKNPELKRIAEMLVNDHSNANARLLKIAESKGWSVPAPPTESPPSSGAVISDFDAQWTTDMIAGHERSVALYRAQAQAGEDPDLRRYARETLPTIEHHLAALKSLQN
jgi:putative membrane protein